MDCNEFFRQATLRICGNLEIEEALQSSLVYLNRFLPVDRLYLQHFDATYGAMRTIATATQSECKKLDLLTPLSGESRKSLALKNLPTDRDVFVFENPDEFSISREMLQFHNVACSSLMVMNLKAKQQMLGSLVVITETETYGEDHAEMLLLLKEPFLIAMANTLKHRELAGLKDLLADDNRFLHGELRRLSGDELVGANYGLREVMFKVQQVAALDSPVLLMGETGVGKDIIANTLHYSSTRSDGPLVSVNCGAIPETLIDSELFGHEKGAFTGALSQKRGRFERAHQGTIFLDEIGELSPQVQVRLLRVLQSKEIERVGGVKTIPLDIRVIAATNRDLEAMVREEKFREDLWFRLNVFPIVIPPLRHRTMDIPALVQHFIIQKAKEMNLSDIPALAPNATEPLMRYHWPGNIRELQNVIERALILNPTGPLSFENSGFSATSSKPALSEQSPEMDNLDQAMSLHIKRVLGKAHGKIHGKGGAAELLGINASTLRNRMNKLGIQYKK